MDAWAFVRTTSYAPECLGVCADDVVRPGVRPAGSPRIVVGQDAEGGLALKQGALAAMPGCFEVIVSRA